MLENKEKDRNEVYSQKIRAGKRSYFFDVKATKGNDYYITITECKKKTSPDGVTYEKHKIFLYKEDVLKFSEALAETINQLKKELPDFNFEKDSTNYAEFDSIDKDITWE